MSFILEALRRADRERCTGDTPDLQKVVESPATGPTRHRSPWLAAAGIAVLGICVAGALLWPRGAEPPQAPAAVAHPPRPAPAPAVAAVALPTPTRAPKAVPTNIPAATQEPKAVAGPEASPDRAPEVSRPAPDSTPQPTLATPAPAVSPAVSPAEPPAVSLAEPPAEITEKSTPPARPPEESQVAGPTEAAPPTPSAPRPETPDRAQATAPEPAPPAVATAPGEVLPVDALPVAQRQLFEGIQLDAHVYADDPSERFVLINMRGHRVGDRVGPGGPQVESITPDGAVLLSGTVRALIPHP